MLAFVIVVAVVIAGLWVAGIGPFPRRGGGNSGASVAQPFRQAYPLALSAAEPETGGPWSLALASGIQISHAVPLNMTPLLAAQSGPYCLDTLLPGASSLPVVPGTSASPSSGRSPAWLMEFSGSSGILFVIVLNGVATPVGTIQETSTCRVVFNGTSYSVPSSVIDSSIAAEAAWTAGGSAFAANHSATDVMLTLVPQVTELFGGVTSVLPALWSVHESNCDLAGLTGSTLDGQPPAWSSVNVNGTTGNASPVDRYTIPCPTSSPALSRALYMGSSALEAVSNGPNYYVNDSVSSLVKAITWSDLDFQVRTPSGAAATGPVNLTVWQAVRFSSPCSVAVFAFSTSTWSAPSGTACNGETLGGGAVISQLQHWSIYSSADLAASENTIRIVGSGPVSGELNLTIVS